MPDLFTALVAKVKAMVRMVQIVQMVQVSVVLVNMDMGVGLGRKVLVWRKARLCLCTCLRPRAKLRPHR